MEDMELAEKIFGIDVPTCKGKWTRPKNKIGNSNDRIELPPKLNMNGREVELAIDVYFVNNEAFLHTLDRTLKCPHCAVLGTHRKGQAYNKENLIEGLNDILQKYNHGDVRIKTIHADNEFA